MRCGVYVRVSTDDQKDNGYSVIYNLECLKNIVKENYNIKAKKIDKLVSIPIDIVIVPYSFL